MVPRSFNQLLVNLKLYLLLLLFLEFVRLLFLLYVYKELCPEVGLVLEDLRREGGKFLKLEVQRVLKDLYFLIRLLELGSL